MEIFSLSGSSGTGKSTSALAFAHQKKIPAIIDDGLLIVNGQKVAGTSAKFEKYTLAAVKRATFTDESHRKEVQQALKSYFIGKILIIGTSDRMTKLIADRLEMGKIQHHYYVEDIRTSSEIKMAQYVRKTEGKHVIPIPYRQVEQNFFKKLIQRGMEIFSNKKERIGETTIVFPDFHKGSIHIEKKVFIDIVEEICRMNPYVLHYDSIKIFLEGHPSVNLNVGIVFPITYEIFEIMGELQSEIHQRFLEFLNIEINSIYIHVTSTSTVKKKESVLISG
ncbi:hypothetical protein [Bacillus massiliigorillae]|uniref:hypothetical protein n=1 Tax=Bacillus massiliigorillae TaxID=1243664 RepID=UPI0003A08585|nr:hypothetical protein [Bacillus massiliigorillae]